MGQKANPNDVRIGITTRWPSMWYADAKNFSRYLKQDICIRKFLSRKLTDAGISRIEIERTSAHTALIIHSSKPGVIIGRSGTAVEDLKKELQKEFGENFEVTIREVKGPDLDAEILAESVAFQISRRVSFRRAAKGILKKAMDAGAKGAKVQISGRLNGAEISRTEFFLEGKIPLQTFRADISYSSRRAETTYGTIGIKVWIFRGEVFKNRLQKKMEMSPLAEAI
ncbi:30S ribosomal protein S3 [Candidatus Peregrinibacteria bacterium]|nr:MAG: 30S ribosomal protein S3 [Candidatus Peregrinibacteria bacterium]